MTTYLRPGKRRSWYFDFVFQGRRHVRGGFPSKTHAEQAQAVVRARLVDARLARDYGIRPPLSRVPIVRAFLEGEYGEELQATLQPRTIRVVSSILGIFVRRFGFQKLSAIVPRDMETYRDERARTISGGMVRQEFRVIGRLFRSAQRRGYVASIPTAGIPLPPENPLPGSVLISEVKPKAKSMPAGPYTERVTKVIVCSIIHGLWALKKSSRILASVPSHLRGFGSDVA